MPDLFLFYLLIIGTTYPNKDIAIYVAKLPTNGWYQKELIYNFFIKQINNNAHIFFSRSFKIIIIWLVNDRITQVLSETEKKEKSILYIYSLTRKVA